MQYLRKYEAELQKKEAAIMALKEELTNTTTVATQAASQATQASQAAWYFFVLDLEATLPRFAAPPAADAPPQSFPDSSGE